MHTKRFALAVGYLAAGIALAAAISFPVRAQMANPLDYPPPKPAFPGQTNAPPPAKKSPAFNVETIIPRFMAPWSLAFLPDGKMLVTERYGFIRVASLNGFYSAPISGVPNTKIVAAESLHDVAVDPDFVHNRLIYFTYFAPPPGEDPGVWPIDVFYGNVWKASVAERRTMRVGEERLARARLSEDEKRLEHVQVLLDGVNRRIVFAPDGTMFVTGADRFRFYEPSYDGTNHEITDPDILRNFTVRVVHINRDGSIPKGNPFLDQPTVLPETYSYGHRDPEGAAINPATGQLWVVEHGPLGGDEINTAVTPPVIISPGGFGYALHQVFGFGYPVYGMGFSFSFPIKNRAAEASLGDALVAQRNDLYSDRQVRQIITLDVTNAVHQLEESKLSTEAAKISYNLAQKNLQAEQHKYELGAGQIQFVLQAQTELAQAEQSMVDAQVGYQLAVTAVEHATGGLLDRFHVEIATLAR